VRGRGGGEGREGGQGPTRSGPCLARTASWDGLKDGWDVRKGRNELAQISWGPNHVGGKTKKIDNPPKQSSSGKNLFFSA